MKLFKNGVGRPSNEVLKNRKIFIISMLALIISLVVIVISGITILIGNNNVNKLKGVATKTFTVKYSANGGKGSMDDQYITYGVKTNLNVNKFTKSGYKFKGWHAKRIVNNKTLYRGCKTSGTCSNEDAKWLSIISIKSYFVYKDKEEVSQIAPIGQTVTMIAQWEKDSSNTIKSSNSSINSTVSSSSKGNDSFWSNLFSTGNTFINLIKKMFSEIKLPTITKPTTTTSEKKKEDENQSTPNVSYASDSIIETKKINKKVCSFPFGTNNCRNKTNASVERIQQMLKTLGFYNSTPNGKYNDETKEAVKKFQDEYNISSNDGVVGYKELLTLANHEKINAPYFILKYEKGENGLNTTIYGTSVIKENNVESIYQVVLKGVGDTISKTHFEHKNGASHIGYFAKRIATDNKNYYYGCDNKNCTKPKWKTAAEKNTLKEKNSWYWYFYKLGDSSIETGKDGEIVVLTAGYCDAMYNDWNRNNSTCTINANLFNKGEATGYLSSPLGINDKTDYSKIANSRYFPRRTKNGDTHGAIDLSMDSGTPIYAMDGGTVKVHSNYQYNCVNNTGVCNNGYNAFGISIEIDHGNGYKSRYAHLSSLKVSSGKVKKGQLIGYSGNTGRSSGPHLHLELINSTEYEKNNGDSNREYVKDEIGRGLMDSALYINKNTTYVDKNK